MLGYPKYKENDIVKFDIGHGQIKTGAIRQVDAYGTFGQNEEVSYDILVEEDNMLYKHVRESWLLQD